MKKTIIASALGALLAGCATPHMTFQGMQDATQEHASAAVQAIAATPMKPASVRELDEPYIDFKHVAASRAHGNVTIKAAGAPFAPLLADVARHAGYSVVFADNVDVTKKVTVEFNSAMAEDVMRNMSFLAGYAAVIDHDRRIVTIADTATYTFKLPAGLLSSLQASYNVGGNSANAGSSSSGSSGGSGGSSGGGTTLQAAFTVTGKEGASAATLQQLIKDVAGGNAQVTISDLGFLSVRANAQSLSRVHDFLRKLSNDAMTQVDIEASVVEVTLAKNFQMGIQWDKVIQTAVGGIGVSSGTALSTIAGNLATGGTTSAAVNSLISASGNTGGIGAFRLTASTASIITALQSFSDVKVVSQPHLFSMNNTPATFFDGTQIPYLGSVSSTASTVSGGSPTVSGSTSFAIDGLSFSVIPSVVDDKQVQITLIPVLSTVGAMQTFNLGSGSTLQVPLQTNKQTYMRVLAESGKTLVIGGIRTGSDDKETSVASSTGVQSSSKELVILLRAAVVPAPEFDPVVAESI